MADRSRARRSPARFLAPLALIAAVAGIYLIAHHALNPGTASTTTHSSGTPATGHRRHRTKKSRHAGTAPAGGTGAIGSSGSGSSGSSGTGGSGATFYTVRSGDTLGAIAAKTGVSIAKLRALNPRLNPNSMQVGQRLRLRR
jgi:LysM repeat protein